MSVERYALDTGEMEVHRNGGYVLHADYEELLAERNALAAENAGLKAKGREVLKEAAYVYSHYNRMVDHLEGENVDGQTLHEFQEAIEMKTPATYAFLAEVRAQGVEMFAKNLESMQCHIEAKWARSFISEVISVKNSCVR